MRVDQAVDQFGGIDILVNNASAIYLAEHIGYAVKAFRPDAWRQRARHFFVFADLSSPSAEKQNRKNPQSRATTEPGTTLV